MAQDLDTRVDAAEIGPGLAGVEARVERLLGELRSLRDERARLLAQVRQQDQERATLEARIADLLRARQHARQEVDELLGALAGFEKRIGNHEHA